MAAQIVHAAGESILEPLPPNTNAVVLSVPDELTLRSLSAQLTGGGIKHKLIVESDKPYSGQATAIGCHPVLHRDEAKKVLSSLPLLKDVSSRRKKINTALRSSDAPTVQSEAGPPCARSSSVERLE